MPFTLKSTQEFFLSALEFSVGQVAILMQPRQIGEFRADICRCCAALLARFGGLHIHQRLQIRVEFRRVETPGCRLIHVGSAQDNDMLPVIGVILHLNRCANTGQ